ncbi:sugar ABC transporter permease [Candidatus Aerophobetes bacterium]|nr:sugar ABC transporter permease [Candidatus Aerophobetes bacterium]
MRSLNKIAKNLIPYFFLLPALGILVGINLFPIIWNVYFSFFDASLLRPTHKIFVGFNNYLEMIKDPVIRLCLRNTLIWTFGSASLQLLIGLTLALVLNQRLPGRGFLRGMALFSWIIPAAMAAIMWGWLLHGELGLINDVLMKLGLIHTRYVWLGDPVTAMISLIIVNVWRLSPLFMIVFLAALQSIPPVLYEAAKIDGASTWHSFRYLTLPLLKPTMGLIFVLGSIWTCNSIDIIYILTGGGPGNETQIFATYAYNQAFKSLRLGYPGAISILMIAFLTLLAVIYLILVKEEIK